MSQNLKTWKKSNICKCSLLKASALKLCKENPSVHQLSIFNASLTSFCSFQCSLTTKRNPLLLRKLGSSFEKTLASSVYTLKFSAVLSYFFCAVTEAWHVHLPSPPTRWKKRVLKSTSSLASTNSTSSAMQKKKSWLQSLLLPKRRIWPKIWKIHIRPLVELVLDKGIPSTPPVLFQRMTEFWIKMKVSIWPSVCHTRLHEYFKCGHSAEFVPCFWKAGSEKRHPCSAIVLPMSIIKRSDK